MSKLSDLHKKVAAKPDDDDGSGAEATLSEAYKAEEIRKKLIEQLSEMDMRYAHSFENDTNDYDNDWDYEM